MIAAVPYPDSKPPDVSRGEAQKAPPVPPVPYPGLRPFDVDDAPIFFGREAQVEAMLLKLEDHRFVAVVGSSGSGKSSLVRAGLLPAVKMGFLLGEKEWITLTIQPGSQPFENLAEGLLKQKGGNGQKNAVEADAPMEATPPKTLLTEEQLERGLTVSALRGSEQGLIETMKELGFAAGTHLVLVVDQFEELFAFRRENISAPETVGRDEAAEFVNLLLAASNREENNIWVVLTMRSDFIGECDAFLALPEAVSRSQFLVPRLDLSQMEQAIVGPGKVSGVAYEPFCFEEGLVKQFLNDAGDRLDLLPLLQHALMRTWRRALNRPGFDGTLTFDDYKKAGKIEGSLSLHADAALRELEEASRQGGPPGSQPAAIATREASERAPESRLVEVSRRLFLLLSDCSSEGKIIRRRPFVSEVMRVAKASLDEVKSVVLAFQRDERNFIEVSSKRFEEDSRLDISHEALLRRWTQLTKTDADGWQARERRSAGDLRRLVARAKAYYDGKEVLLPQRLLDNIAEWDVKEKPTESWAVRYVEREEWLTVQKYIKESEGECVRIAKEKARQKLQDENTRRRHRNLLICLSLILTICAIGATVFAII